MNDYLVSILMGSESDKEWAEKIAAEFKSWNLPYEMNVLSAHKVPEKVMDLVRKNNASGKKICYVTIAGRSNGLSGVTAASSIHPVIACPPFSDKTDMLVNIHSTLQMPGDTPVLTVLDPKNAVLAVIRIFALDDAVLQGRVAEHIEKIKSSFKG